MMKGRSGGLKALSALLLLTACAGQNSRPEAEKVTVTVETVRMSEGLGAADYVGEVRAAKTAVLSSRHSGTLEALNVSQGDRVSKGQTVAQVNSSMVQSSYDMAQATLKQAEDGYERVSKVHGSGSVADVKLVEVQTQLAKARAAMASAEQALEDCRIKAPFAGTVAEVYADQGVEASPAQPLVKIVDMSSVEIVIPVPEAEVNGLETGCKAYMDVPALGLEAIEVRLKSKGVTASPLSHTYDCTLVPPAPVKGLMPGMVCKVYMTREGGKAVVIPARVVRTDMNGRYVWTVDGTGRVCKKYVTVGGFSGEGVMIKEGLQEGDRLITEGSYKVSTGMEVKVK